jgi:elongator complex protein 4
MLVKGNVTDEMGKFCHHFDLGKRLDTSCIRGPLSFYPSSSLTSSSPRTTRQRQARPLVDFIYTLESSIEASSPRTVHRVVVPSLLSPALYNSSCSHPSEVLPFIIGLRALLRRFNDRLTVMLTLPLSLHARSSGLIRWVEHCCDGVLELSPLTQARLAQGTGNKPVQGQMRQHCLPIHHERGGGWEDGKWRGTLSFKLSGSDGLVIEPFSLPPVDDENSNSHGSHYAKGNTTTLDF